MDRQRWEAIGYAVGLFIGIFTAMILAVCLLVMLAMLVYGAWLLMPWTLIPLGMAIAAAALTWWVMQRKATS